VFVVNNVWLIVVPLPPAAPDMLGLGATVQVNVVPGIFCGAAKILTTKGSPLQVVMFAADAEGNGFTVTTKSTGSPMHPLKSGVIR
jgi:hypothetical protein